MKFLKKEMNKKMKGTKMKIQMFNDSKIRSFSRKPIIKKTSLARIEVVESDLVTISKRINDLMVITQQRELDFVKIMKPEVLKAELALLIEIVDYQPKKTYFRYALGVKSRVIRSRLLQSSELNLPGRLISKKIL